MRIVLGAAALVLGWFGTQWVDSLRPSSVLAITVAADPVPVPVPVPVPDPVVAEVAVAAPPVAPADSDLLGTFFMTRYYVAEETSFSKPRGEVVLADGVSSGTDITIYDNRRGCRPLATISRSFTTSLDIQGTGKLRDGRVVNVSGPCNCGHSPCYRAMTARAQWGMSAMSKPLEPFRSIAVDRKVVKLGSVLYIAELDGVTMPGKAPWGGFVHDGCVIATDVGGNIDGKQIDFFVGRHAYRTALDRRKKMKHVTVYRGEERCARSGPHVARNAGI